eukprot:s1171_g23.t1
MMAVGLFGCWIFNGHLIDFDRFDDETCLDIVWMSDICWMFIGYFLDERMHFPSDTALCNFGILLEEESQQSTLKWDGVDVRSTRRPL